MKMFTPDELRHLAERTGFAWLACITKTCLVQRRHEGWLEDKAVRLRLLEREEEVHADPPRGVEDQQRLVPGRGRGVLDRPDVVTERPRNREAAHAVEEGDSSLLV